MLFVHLDLYAVSKELGKQKGGSSHEKQVR